MAYSKEQWERTKALFESGQYSLGEITEKTGISKSKISEKSKREQWERGRNSDYIEAKSIIARKKGTEKGTVINVLDEIAEDKIRREGLIFGNAELMASKIPTFLDNIDDTKSFKDLADANMSLGKQLGVIEQFAPKSDIKVEQGMQNIAPTQINIIRDN